MNNYAKQRGFSIIELMVASVLSLILMNVIIQLFISNKQAYRLQEGASELNENARYAINHIQHYMRMGDHWGAVESDVVSISTGVPALVTGTTCAGVDVPITSEGFRGYAGVTTGVPVTCIAAANYETNTDAFYVRYARSIPNRPDAAPATVTEVATWNPQRVAIRTQVGVRAQVFRSNLIASDSALSDLTPGSDPINLTNYEFAAHLYYVRPCTFAGSNGTCGDSGDDAIPALVRRNLDGFTFNEEVLVSGVEAMNLHYGIDESGDLVADYYDNAASVTANATWAQVVSVRVNLVIANLTRDNTLDLTTLGQTSFTFPDGRTWTVPTEARQFRRQQYDFIVQVRNQTRA
ncbi:MAG: PilW family protein [Pseudomonadota bacterium]